MAKHLKSNNVQIPESNGQYNIEPNGLNLAPVSHYRVLTEGEVRKLYGPPATLNTPEEVRIACDNQLAESGVYSLLQHSIAMGQMPKSQFLGYGNLQQIAQNGMIRACIQTVADDMTRAWIDLKQEGEQDAEKVPEQVFIESLGLEYEQAKIDADRKISSLVAEMKRQNLQSIFHDAASLVGYMGGAFIFIDTGESDPEALKQPLNISSASAELSKERILRFVLIDPINVFPGLYNSTSPLRPDYFIPRTWWILDKEIHASRLLRLVANELPVLLKPSYNFLGIAQAQILWDYVIHFQEVRVASQRLLNKYSLTVMKTDMANVLTQAGGLEQLDRRVNLLVQHMSNDGVQVIDKEAEDIVKVESTLSGVTDIVRQALEILASMNRTPAVKLLGISPSGFNATGESDIRNYYDYVVSQQEKVFRSALNKILNILQIKLFGTFDPTITFDFASLSEEDETAKANTQKIKADTMGVLLTNQVVSPEECRKVLANDLNSGFVNLDIDEMPENLDLSDLSDDYKDLKDDNKNIDQHVDDDNKEQVESKDDIDITKEVSNNVQQLSLNGAQVSSMIEVVNKIRIGEISRESGIAILKAAFPISQETAIEIVGSVGLNESKDTIDNLNKNIDK